MKNSKMGKMPEEVFNMFGLIGFFVLLLACINFMNLSTARSEQRAKEVGVRKTIGSVKKQLVAQFLSESLIVVFIAFLITLVLMQLSLPWFNTITDKQIAIPLANLFFWLLCGLFISFTGLLAGSYPAFYLSAFNPVKILKGTFKAGRFATVPRKILVVTQFTVSVALIICTIVVYKQIQFAKNRPVGYNRERLITIPMNTPDLYGHYDALKDDLLKTGAVENMCESASPTTDIWNSDGSFEWKGKDINSPNSFGIIACTHDFGKTVGWQIKEGRDFSKAFADSSSLILNETAVKLMGLKNPVGEKIKWGWRAKDYTVVGVVKDMVISSPFGTERPAIFWMDYEAANIITVKLKLGLSTGDALAKTETVFKKYNPGSPFQYSFVDEDYGKKFSAETRIGKLSVVFSVLAVFISCLGIFGLALFVAEKRTKEIGVRKVLGASVRNVWALLSKEFVLLVAVSFLIASPLAYYFMNNWLVKYEYRTNISWWVFIVTGVGALMITIFTVSFQAIKAAVANPVKSLKSE
jgi:putative ABC transport system permease protein